MSSSESSPERSGKLDRHYGSGDTEHSIGVSNYKLAHGHVRETEEPPPADALRVDFKHDLYRGLKSRQIAMVSSVQRVILIVDCNRGSYRHWTYHRHWWYCRFLRKLIPKAALVRAGPAGVLISYCLIGFVIYMVMTALGEMSAYLPLPEGFSGCKVSLLSGS
jgi:hypothetical protein